MRNTHIGLNYQWMVFPKSTTGINFRFQGDREQARSVKAGVECWLRVATVKLLMGPWSSAPPFTSLTIP